MSFPSSCFIFHPHFSLSLTHLRHCNIFLGSWYAWMRMESFLIYVTPPHLYVTFIEVGLWLEILFCVPQTLIFFFFEKSFFDNKTIERQYFSLMTWKTLTNAIRLFSLSNSFIYLFIHRLWLIMNQQLYTKKRTLYKKTFLYQS